MIKSDFCGRIHDILIYKFDDLETIYAWLWMENFISIWPLAFNKEEEEENQTAKWEMRKIVT